MLHVDSARRNFAPASGVPNLRRSDAPPPGGSLHDWSTEDRKQFRSFARERWNEWKAKSPAAAALVDSHVQFMSDLGLID